ncbi:transposase family protein [Streptomyces sp. NPDC048361]|uniref:transposase family protein n=1 Tax=Streptomyces sp. NPDC048361 TaxID=3154720 RepID=UPI0034127CF9
MVCQLAVGSLMGRARPPKIPGVLYVPWSTGKTVPVDASSLIPAALDQPCEHPGIAPDEMPGLLERLAQVPDPRGPRGVRHPSVVVLALAACTLLAGGTSLPAVGEWIAHAPPHVLEHVGVQLDPLFPNRSLSAETTVRRLLARIDGDPLDRALGRRRLCRGPWGIWGQHR